MALSPTSCVCWALVGVGAWQSLAWAQFALPQPSLPPISVPRVGSVAPIIKAAPVTGVAPITKAALLPVVTAGSALGWRAGADRAVTALAQDGAGRLWVATEDAGVWRHDPTASASARWQQFTAKDGLGDDSAYALAVDKQGRVWAGTLNHGVSVWNGTAWKNFGVLEGPLGERVFDIAVCPTDGDVWIATNAGLTRYSPEKDTWSYLTRADGLPSDQVQALAFDKAGNLVVGTQCDGVALASAQGGYKSWKSVAGPEKMPLTPTGKGLPSSLINDVLVAGDGTLYAATTTGLAWSRDKGASWAYVRGADYAAKVKGLYGGPPEGWAEAPGAVLAEDYVSCLAEDADGRIWLGHWQTGSEVLEMQSSSSQNGTSLGGVKGVVAQGKSNYVRAILASGSASPLAPLLARYDEGIEQASRLTRQIEPTIPVGPQPDKATPSKATSTRALEAALPATAAFPSLPSPAASPSVAELQQWMALASGRQQPLPPGSGVFLDEDWRTGGDWLGRYGRQRTVLCAAQAPLDNNFGFDRSFQVEGFLGPHALTGDRLRHWLATTWIKTDDRRALYNPVEGYRRQGEWDDHGETYPSTHAGPDVWVKCTVPAGVHRLSLYFFNENGSRGQERQRDYLLELKKGEASSSAEAELLPAQARTRVRDFRGGLYKRFLVSGPGRFWVKVGKNNSFNTLVSGVFLDKMAADPTIFDAMPLPWMSNVRYEVPAEVSALDASSSANAAEPPPMTAARELWDSLLLLSPNPRVSLSLPQGQVVALRAISGAGEAKHGDAQSAEQGVLPGVSPVAQALAPQALARRWRWLSTQWTTEDRREWRAVVARGYAVTSSKRTQGTPLTAPQQEQALEMRKARIAATDARRSTTADPVTPITPNPVTSIPIAPHLVAPRAAGGQ